MNTRDAFETAMEFVLAHEGGYVSDPRDPGGETNFGISRKSYPGLDIAGLTRGRAKAIYRRDFWNANSLGALPPLLGSATLDAAVNMGSSQAVKLLQRCLNQIARAGLLEDGVCGPQTIAAANNLSQTMIHLAAKQALLARSSLYVRLSGRKSLRAFLRGWIKRTTSLSDFLDATFPMDHDEGP